MLRKKKKVLSAQHLTGNAIHQKMLYVNPNPLPQIAPPSLRGNLCSEISDLFFSINFGWRERKKKHKDKDVDTDAERK